MELHQFYKRYQLHKACGNDDLRPDFSYVMFANGYAYATDAHICVKSKISTVSTLTDEQALSLNGLSIHGDLFRNLSANHAGFEIRQTEDGRTYLSAYDEDQKNRVDYYLRDDVKIPSFDRIFSAVENSRPVTAIGIKPKFMERLCRAMGVSDTMRLDLHGNDKAIFITDKIEIHDIHGIIMPVIVDEPELQFPTDDPSDDTADSSN